MSSQPFNCYELLLQINQYESLAWLFNVSRLLCDSDILYAIPNSITGSTYLGAHASRRARTAFYLLFYFVSLISAAGPAARRWAEPGQDQRLATHRPVPLTDQGTSTEPPHPTTGAQSQSLPGTVESLLFIPIVSSRSIIKSLLGTSYSLF